MKNTAKARGETHGVQDGGCGVHLCRGKRCGGSSAGGGMSKVIKQIEKLELQLCTDRTNEYIAENYLYDIVNFSSQQDERIHQDIDYFRDLIREYILSGQNTSKLAAKLITAYSSSSSEDEDEDDYYKLGIWHDIAHDVDKAIHSCREPIAEYYTGDEEIAAQFLVQRARNAKQTLSDGAPIYFKTQEQCERVANRINKLLVGSNISAEAARIREFSAYCGEPRIFGSEPFEWLDGFEINFKKMTR